VSPQSEGGCDPSRTRLSIVTDGSYDCHLTNYTPLPLPLYYIVLLTPPLDLLSIFVQPANLSAVIPV